MISEYELMLGNTVKELRIKKNMTQEQLSIKLQVSGCDITRSAVAKIEVGQRHIYPHELRALKQILSVSYDELLK